MDARAVSSVAEHSLDVRGVVGSNPTPPTKEKVAIAIFSSKIILGKSKIKKWKKKNEKTKS